MNQPKLISLTIQVLIGFFALLISASASPQGASDPNRLPKIFGSLAWQTTQKDIHAVFPNAKIQEITATDGEKITLIYGLSSPKLGNYNVHIVWRDQRISQVTLSSDERRKQCAPGIPSRPKSCRNVYGEPLQKLFGELRRELEHTYGPPQVNPVVSDHRAKEPQVSYGWALPASKILLTMFIDEEDLWSVSVSVTRAK